MKWYKNKQLRPYFQLTPAFLLIVSLLGYGVAYGIMESFHTNLSWSIGAFQGLFRNKSFINSIGYSLSITLASTCLSIWMGVAITHSLYPYLMKNRWKAVIWIPMLFPHFAAGYLIVLLFSDSGLVSAFLYKVGLISNLTNFPSLVNDANGVGIIITYVWKEIPFVVLMLLPIYARLDIRLKDVVRTFGGNRVHVFLTAYWPFLWPAILEIAIILFAFILAGFEVPYLLGVTFPKMTPVLAFEWFFDGSWEQRPLAFAAMFLLTCFILLLTIIIYWISQKYRHRLMRGS